MQCIRPALALLYYVICKRHAVPQPPPGMSLDSLLLCADDVPDVVDNEADGHAVLNAPWDDDVGKLFGGEAELVESWFDQCDVGLKNLALEYNNSN